MRLRKLLSTGPALAALGFASGRDVRVGPRGGRNFENGRA